MDSETLLARIHHLLGLIPIDGPSDQTHTVEAYAGAVTVAAAICGPENAYAETLKRAEEDARRNWGMPFLTDDMRASIRGVLNAMAGDIKFGVVASIEQRGYGQAMVDLLEGAKATLSQGEGPGETQVAAVLAAAAFEDTMRRMGTALAGMPEEPRPTLETTIQGLKSKNLLQGAEAKLAHGYQQFRKDALHANWARVDRPTVQGCLTFTESMVVKHFS